MKNDKAYWLNYWKSKTCGEHRSQKEEFLEKEAKEKLFHLDGGNNLLDFGCGSADLLAYYSGVYTYCVGADFSAQMLEKAGEQLRHSNTLHKVRLINADDSRVWQEIKTNHNSDFTFDRITAGQVIQYLGEKQVEDFIRSALDHLSEDGRICLFDVVDSRTYELWSARLFGYSRFNCRVLSGLIRGRLRAVKNKLIGKPEYELGYMYAPAFFNKLAGKYNLNLSIAHSMYYEYRYHVMLSRQTNGR